LERYTLGPGICGCAYVGEYGYRGFQCRAFAKARIIINMKISIDSNKLYSGIATFYDASLWLFGYKFAVSYFIGIIPFNRKARLNVLDAGCGTGLYTFALLKRFPNAVIKAFDLNANMIEVMKNTIRQKSLDDKIEVSIGDVTKPIPYQREQFDLIMTGGVLEYLSDPMIAVKNLSLYLKKNGYFLNSPVKDNLLGRLVAKFYKFTPHSSITNINAFIYNGFTLERMRSFPIIKEAHLFKKL